MPSFTFLDRDFEEAPDTERSSDELPDEVAGIEPLGPAPARLPPPAGSWEAFVLTLYPQSPESMAPPRYKVEFIANDEYVSLLDRARLLVSQALPEAGLEEIQLRAMRAYVAELEGQPVSSRRRARRGR